MPHPEDPIVVKYEEPDTPDRPDIVYLHARGSTEREAGMANQLLGVEDLRAYRGPLREGGGFAWFQKTGIGQAILEDLHLQVDRVHGWIMADSGRALPWISGFSNGAAMAASIMLQYPERYAGLIMIGGCFPFTELPANRLSGKPVLFCRGKTDSIIPESKFVEAEDYIRSLSGAHATLISHEGGHELPLILKADFRTWIASAVARRS